MRDGIPRASRPFESPMTLAIRNSRATVAPDPSLVAAGADEAEADPAQRIATDPSVIDAERHAMYRDGVEHVTTLDGLSGGHKSCSTSSTPPAEPVRLTVPPDVLAPTPGQARGIPVVTHAGNGHGATSESVRLGRLSRWQEQR